MDDPEQVIPGIRLYFNKDYVFEEWNEGSLGSFMKSYDPNTSLVDVEEKRNEEM